MRSHALSVQILIGQRRKFSRAAYRPEMIPPKRANVDKAMGEFYYGNKAIRPTSARIGNAMSFPHISIHLHLHDVVAGGTRRFEEAEPEPRTLTVDANILCPRDLRDNRSIFINAKKYLLERRDDASAAVKASLVGDSPGGFGRRM